VGGEIVKLPLHHPGAASAGNIDRIILTVGIQDHAVIRPGHAFKASAQVAFFILGANQH
jgi:hypothetical protein